MNVLVFADSFEGAPVKSSFEVITYGAKVAANTGGKATIITYGALNEDSLNNLASYGIADVLHASSITEMDPSVIAAMVHAAADKVGAELVVFSHDYTGKSVAAMTAARMKAGLVSGAIEMPDTSGDFTVMTTVFSGKAFAKVKINSERKVISLLPNSISKEKGDTSANVEAFAPDAGQGKLRIKSFKAAGGEGINLTEADLVVSAGRGLKGPENWGMIEELAATLGAATACSRPVADIGWRPHHEHVGQTGVAIRPNLYIAIGISGAIQHLAGVNGSKVIVVVNTDPEAPFFKAADYGIVGDAFEVVPKLLAAAKSFKAAQA